MPGSERRAAGIDAGYDGVHHAAAVLSIDLDAIVANYRLLRDRAAGADCAAVVKADAYGLGVAPVARALAAAGCRRFFVAQLEEGMALRQVLAEPTIYVLNGPIPGSEPVFTDHKLVPVLNHLGQIDAWRAHARACGRTLAAVIHIDTGMNRLGLPPGEVDRLAAEPDRLDGIAPAAWMSHLVSAEVADDPRNRRQRDAFAASLSRLPPAPASLANSSGVFLGPDFHLDMVRPGAALYGVSPVSGIRNPMAQPVSLAARILQLRDVDSPQTVGYGATHHVAGPGKIATVALGYADGFLRCLSNRGRCYIDDMPVPVVGRVSMDLITLDVTGVAPGRLAPGDVVEVLGPCNTVDAVAAAAGTIGYEILTALGRRYHRRYTGAGAH